MKTCPHCKYENMDGANFCEECGNDLHATNDAPTREELQSLAEKLNQQAVSTIREPFNPIKFFKELISKIWKGIRESVFFRKKKNTIITFSSIVLAILLVIGTINSGYIAFTIAYNSESYEIAESIQKWPINSAGIKKSISKFVVNKAEGYYNDYLEEKISYEEANGMINVAGEFTNVSSARAKAKKLYDSRTAYKKAEEHEKKGELYDAVIEYKKVIEADKNYNEAQKRIEKNKPEVKREAIAKMDECIEVNDFTEGLRIVADMERIFTNDSDISRYKQDFEDRKEAHRIQELKDNQKVKVTRAYAYNDGYYYVFRKGVVVMQNCTSQVIKDMTYVILFFDSNGFPVKADYSIYAESGASNSTRVGVDSANVQPGKTYGGNRYVDIPDNATKIKACVKSAEFYDGGTWNNPYYDHWIKTEKDRY